jgi:hypothetical protein
MYRALSFEQIDMAPRMPPSDLMHTAGRASSGTRRPDGTLAVGVGDDGFDVELFPLAADLIVL